MMTIYPDNPYYNLLVYFLIKYRLRKINFKENLFVKLSKEAQQELTDILTRNLRLTLLEQHKPGFSDKKTFDAGEYYRLEKQNAELLNVEFEPPTLVDLSARALSVYAIKQGLFDDTRIETDEKTQKIGILAKEQPWYGNRFFGKKYTKSPQRIHDELFEKVMTVYKTKTTLEKIKEKYKKINKFYLVRHFKFNDAYFSSIANFLLECTINKDNADFSKRLLIFDKYGNREIFDTLDSITPLHIACELDAPTVLVEELIINGCNVNDPKRNKYWTPLHQACLFNASLALIDELLKHGAKLTTTDSSHNITPLHIACHLGHDQLAFYLLQQGAKMNAAVRSSKLLVFEEHYYYFNANALHLALKANCKLAAQYMIENNSDFSQITEGKIHVFHLACQYASQAIVKLLSEKLTDLHIEDQNKLNPADYALMNSNQDEKTKILEILKSFQILPTKSDKEVRKLLSGRNGLIDYGSSFSITDSGINYPSLM